MLKKITLILTLVLSMSVLLVNCGPSNPFVTGARIDMKRGDFEVAKDKLVKALKSNPKLEEAAYLMGICYVKDGDYKNMDDADFLKMKESFDLAMSVGATYKADIAIHTKNAFNTIYGAGIEQYNAGVSELNKEAIDKAKERFEKAKNKLEIAKKVNPDDMSVVKLLANTNLQLKDKDAAKTLYGEALAKDANDVTALKYLAMILSDEGQDEKAIEYYNKIVNIPLPASAAKGAEKEIVSLKAAKKDAAVKIAAYYEKKEEYDKALPMYEKLLVEEPNNITVLFNQGIMFSKQKKFDKAIEVFSKIVKIDGTDSEAKIILAGFYYDSSEFQKAVDYLEPFYSEFTPEFQAKSNDILFSSYMKLGKGKEAEKYFVK